MTIEQMNAFQEWWNKSSIGCDRGTDCREAFASGWEARAAITADSQTAPVSYTAARLDSYNLGKSEERADIERRLLAMAGHAFIANKDEHAHWFRSLVNVLFKNPGDPSA